MPTNCPKRNDWRALEEDACIKCTSRQGLYCEYDIKQFGRFGETRSLSAILSEEEMTILLNSNMKEQPKVEVEHIYHHVYPKKKDTSYIYSSIKEEESGDISEPD